MAASSPATLIIACPQCGTRYQLARDALGEGREVKCAHCATSWTATPAAPPLASESESDALFDAAAEDQLDAAFDDAARAVPDPAQDAKQRTIEEIKRVLAPRPAAPAAPRPAPEKGADAAALQKRALAFSRRRDTMMRKLPMGRLRRSARITGVAALVVLVGGGLLFRNPIVSQLPDLAGIYSAIGLPINVLGLDFKDVRTLEMLRDGSRVLVVSGRVVPIAGRLVPVPPVVVTLLNDEGEPLYEWSVQLKARELEPGEAIDFETQLSQPPVTAARVHLSFANARARPETTPVTPANGG